MRVLNIVRDHLLSEGYTNVFINHAPKGDCLLIRSVWDRPRTADGAKNVLHEIVEIQAHKKKAADLNIFKNGIIDHLIGLNLLDGIVRCTLNRQETFKKKTEGWVWLAWFEIWGQITPN